MATTLPTIIFTNECNCLAGWCLTTVPVTKTVGVGHSRRYCNTRYDQSQGRRPSTLKCIGPISKGDIEPNHPFEINSNSDSSSSSDGRSRWYVQYWVDQSLGQRPRSLLQSNSSVEFAIKLYNFITLNSGVLY